MNALTTFQKFYRHNRAFVTTAMVIVLTVFSIPADARTVITIISSNQTPAQANQRIKDLLTFSANLDAGDRVVFVDGTAETLGEFILPEDPRLSSPRARVNLNSALVKKLFQFAERCRADSQGVDYGQTLDVPAVMRQIAGRYSTDSARKSVDVLLVGSPVYNPLNDLGYSMWGGLVPTDANITTSRQNSPYGVAEMQQALTGLNVYWLLVDPYYQSKQHEVAQTRFWALWFAQLGAKLRSITAGTNDTLDLVRARGGHLPERYQLDPNTQLGMMRFRGTNNVDNDIYSRPLTTVPMAKELWRKPAPLTVGLRWSCAQCDIDLYARKNSTEDWLYYAARRNADGQHVKDFTSSPLTSNGYETIEYWAPVNLDKLDLGIAFYSGHAPTGADVEVRVMIEGHTYAKTFHIPAIQGEGAGNTLALLNEGKSSERVLALKLSDVIRTVQ